MDKMYAEIVFETRIPIANPENLIVSLDTIEFMVPELFRLDFSTIRTKIYTRNDGICELKVYGYDFNYETFKADYEKLGIEPDGFVYEYFKSLLNKLEVTEIIADCLDKSRKLLSIPLCLKDIKLYFDHTGGDTAIDFTPKVTAQCRKKLLDGSEPDLMTVISEIYENSDYSCYRKAFANALLESIRTDDEKPERMGRYIMKAIKENSFDDLMIALCGWSLKSLMQQAYILRDDDCKFHDEIIDAKLVGIWDNDVREELSCKVNTKTREVYDIDQDFDGPKGKSDFNNFNEYVLIEGIDFPVVSEKFKSDNPLAFWYGDK